MSGILVTCCSLPVVGMYKLILQKFGGTSVQDAEAITRAIEIVRERGMTRRMRPLVVLSACAGVTNALIRVAELSLREHPSEALALVDQLEARHARIARELLMEESAVERVQLRLHLLWDELRALVRGVHLLRELTPRSRDQIQSLGERASSIIFQAGLAARLNKAGVVAHLYEARDFFFTSNEFTNARPLPSEIARRMRRIHSALAKGAVGVTQGFIGRTLSGEVTTIGRGGSDFSAAIMGVALGATEIQIWTDVAGILTCDPRIVPEARSIEQISFLEASELAFFGAKVLHPETIWPAVEKGIPVRVLSSKEPERAGTVIVKQMEETRPMAGIAIKRGAVIARLRAGGGQPDARAVRMVWEALAESRTIPMAVSVSVDSAAYVFSDGNSISALRAASEGLGSLEVETDRSLITLVGTGLRQQSGIALRIFRALGKINCEMISYGGSQSAIGLVVRDEVATRIVKRLHAEFFA